MKNSTYLILALLGPSFSLFYAMDQAPESIKSRTLIAFETLLNHYIIFNHTTACSLALVNKYGNKKIKDTALLRKKHLETIRPIEYKRNQAHLIWHLHGGAYAEAYYSIDSKTLIMNYIYLNEENREILVNKIWDNEPHELLNNPHIFFNQKGEACYYASGIMQVLGHGKKREIIEYALSIDNQSKETRCVLGKTNKKKEFRTMSLAHIAKNSFPDLTQAILNSCHQEELSTPWHKDRVKVFHWDGVKVPQRYLDSKLYLDSKGKPMIKY